MVQTVKEAANRQNEVSYFGRADGSGTVQETKGEDPFFTEKACFARHFDLLHKSNPTVPMYADGFDLFVFGASLTSDSLSKTAFLTDWGGAKAPPSVVL